VGKWAAPDELNRIELACRALLASPLEGKTVLFETGIGAFFDPRMRERYGVQESQHVLIDSLREAGFEHEDIDVVVLSHLHFDHAGGLLAAWSEGREPELLFPNATYVVGAQHWQRAMQPHPRDRASFIPELPGLCRPAVAWKWWTASIRRFWVAAFASATAMATRRG
jgi:glyoxylase-like metal-dependent hydrolase (beta-lactamase superfamily II)